jgi:glycosyltransferase involved in cell wall biosynthesis
MLFPLQVILLRLQLGRKVPVIVQNHAEKPGRRHLKLFQRLADPCIDVYLFTAKEMAAEWIKKGIIRQPEKVRAVMEASSAFQPMDRIQARAQTAVTGNPVFLWVGRLNQNKDPLTCVRAFLKFVTTEPSARLYMIFQTRELLSSVETLIDQTPHSRNNIVLIGDKPHEEMAAWYNASDFIISASHYEGSGIAVCEAMSCGCIPVLTNILSFRMMTDNGKCGLLYEAGKEESLFTALQRAMDLDRTIEREKVLLQFRSELSFSAIADGIHRIAAWIQPILAGE